MENAYDLKKLAEQLKAIGLEQAEELAGKIYVVTKDWLKESAVASKTPFDDLALPFLDQLDKIILPQIDKIDGKEG